MNLLYNLSLRLSQALDEEEIYSVVVNFLGKAPDIHMLPFRSLRAMSSFLRDFIQIRAPGLWKG